MKDYVKFTLDQRSLFCRDCIPGDRTQSSKGIYMARKLEWKIRHLLDITYYCRESDEALQF